MNILIHAPSDFNNLCVLTRTLECFGICNCTVFDPHRLVRERYGKSYSQRLRTLSAGAFSKIRFTRIDDTEAFIRAYAGRSLATVPDPSARSLYAFQFKDDDLVVFGSEACGLPEAIIGACDAKITIPQTGITQSLNLCVAASIIVSEWSRQRQERTAGQLHS